jgi:hypothetical protein
MLNQAPALPISCESRRTTLAFLLHVQNLSNCIGRILAWDNIKAIHFPLPKTYSVVRLVKDSLGLKYPESTRSHANVGPSALLRQVA